MLFSRRRKFIYLFIHLLSICLSVSRMTSKLIDEFSPNCHHRSQVMEERIRFLGLVERIPPPLMFVKIKSI